MPGGDGSAPLTYNMPLTYVDGVYRFLDANGNLAEVHIEWCQLQINADGLKLAIILPIGLVSLLALASVYFQWAANRAVKRRLNTVSEKPRRVLAAHRELEAELNVPLANAS